jgi:hypothetical protein
MTTLKLTNEREFERKLERFAKKSGESFDRILAKNTARMHNRAVQLVPVGKSDGPRARQQIKITGKGEVTSQAEHSAFIEYGTEPHTIRVKNKKVLAGPKRTAPSGWNNFSRDWAIYGKEIKHPGTEEQPFMRPAWEYGKRRLLHDIEEEFK